MGKSLGLAVYLAVSSGLEPLARQILRRRIAAGKEDPQRSEERIGRPGMPRPEGEIIWMHSASVGEVVSILRVVEMIGRLRPDLRFLITTGTLSSARLLLSRMPRRTVHQFLPYDVRSAVEGFLDHWRPSLGIWTESELWPALICETHRRRIPLLFVNARMSRKSYRRWRWIPGFSASLLRRFRTALVQDSETGRYLRRLGLPSDRIEVTGSLKMGAGMLPHDCAAEAAFARACGDRRIWLAASTHSGEEEIVADAHALVEERQKGTLLIVVPRHPERGGEVAGMLSARGFRVRCRSTGELPDADDQIYVADTLGELGLWYRVAPVSFVGGSMVKSGGHNPYEPALLESAIVHGPHVSNFSQDFGRLESAGATMRVTSARELADAIDRARDAELTKRMTRAALGVCADGDAIVNRAVDAILARMPPKAGSDEAA